MTDKTKAEQALELWREWFVEDGCPTYAGECGGDISCFFCGEWSFGEEDCHEPDCIFVRAKKLIDSLED